MISRIAVRRTVPACLIVLACNMTPARSASAGAPRRQGYRDVFRLGRRAANLNRWKEALAYYQHAYQLEPRDGGMIRMTGRFYESYLPRYHMGLALFQISEYDRALDIWSEWDTSDVAHRSVEYANMRRLRRRYLQSILPDAQRYGRERYDGTNTFLTTLARQASNERDLDITLRGISAHLTGCCALLGTGSGNHEAIRDALTDLDKIDLDLAHLSARAHSAASEAPAPPVRRSALSPSDASALADAELAGILFEAQRCCPEIIGRLERARVDSGVQRAVQGRVLIALAGARHVCRAGAVGALLDEAKARIDIDDIGRLNRMAEHTRPLYAGSYALVVSANAYRRSGWETLEHGHADVAAVRDVLGARGFSVTAVHDPTRSGFDAAVDRFIRTYGRERDNRLVFYYTGHGEAVSISTRTRTPRPEGLLVARPTVDYKVGYIVPVDAPSASVDPVGFLTTAVSMDRIAAWARRIQAKHVLFVLDSCYSGAIFSVLDKDAEDQSPLRRTTQSGSAAPHIRDAAANPVKCLYLRGTGLNVSMTTVCFGVCS